MIVYFIGLLMSLCTFPSMYISVERRLLQRLMLLMVGVVILNSVVSSNAGNQTGNENECVLADIHSRLDVATEILEGVKQKIPKHLNDTCVKTTCDDKPINCSECENIPCKEKPINCSDCRNITCEQKPLNCSECEEFLRDAKPLDCSDIYKNGNRTSGIYEVWPQSRISKGPVVVYCDMEDGGGWTVFQRRGDFNNSYDYFNKGWKEYEEGFGDLSKEFWLGNKNIYALTNQRSYEIKIDLRDFDGNFKYAAYRSFWIENDFQNYTLRISGYKLTEGDSFLKHNGKAFSTSDSDTSPGKWAVKLKGAWWYSSSLASNLNGLYLKGETKQLGGVTWYEFRKTHYYSLKDTTMKIRPVDFGKTLLS